MTTTPSSSFLDDEHLDLTESFPFYHSGVYKQNTRDTTLQGELVVFPFTIARMNTAGIQSRLRLLPNILVFPLVQNISSSAFH